MADIIPKGMWFEELTPGLVVQHALRRTVTESDNVQFTVATMNPAPLHLDFAYAETTQFGRPLVNSMFTVALVVGLSVHELTHGTTVANLGFEKVNFPAPVFHVERVDDQFVAARINRWSTPVLASKCAGHMKGALQCRGGEGSVVAQRGQRILARPFVPGHKPPNWVTLAR